MLVILVSTDQSGMLPLMRLDLKSLSVRVKLSRVEARRTHKLRRFGSRRSGKVPVKLLLGRAKPRTLSPGTSQETPNQEVQGFANKFHFVNQKGPPVAWWKAKREVF